MSDTVTDFRERASPDAMKAEIGDYFRTRADALMDRARENPLQTAAIGIGVGYPLLKIARSIPAPILMVGAGLYLLGTSSGQKLSDTVSKKVVAAADGVSDSFSAGVDVANRKIHDTQDLAASGLSAARDTLASGVESATQKAAAFGSSLNQLKDGAASLVGSASDSATGLKQRAVGALGATSDAMSASVARTGSTRSRSCRRCGGVRSQSSGGRDQCSVEAAGSGGRNLAKSQLRNERRHSAQSAAVWRTWPYGRHAHRERAAEVGHREKHHG